MKPIRFHDLRHTHASVLWDLGVPVPVITQRLGHASAQMLISTYGHALDGRGAEAAEAFARAVGSGPGER